MVADKEDRGEALIDPLHLAQQPVAAAEQAGVPMQILDEDVGHRSVAVADHDLTRPTGQRSLDGRVRLLRHQAPKPFILFLIGLDVLGDRHARDPFHVD